jgi:hypothetical protein
MNNLIKFSVAAALATGSVAANAQITVGGSSSDGDAILFADIFNGTTLVSAYAGDIGATVDSLGAGTVPTTFDDANLQSFLATAAANPTDTVYWVVGGAGNVSNHPVAVTSAPTAGSIGTENGLSLKGWSTELGNLANNINTGIAASATPTAASWLTTNSSTLSGTGFNGLQATAPDLANWGQNSGNVTTTGIGGTAVDLYKETASGIKGTNPGTETAVLAVSLTSGGLVFSSLTPVPVPAAVWLLGSGLLGLAGVARRKSTAV